MRWTLLLGVGALCINVCAAADHNQLLRDKGIALWQDLKAGKVAKNPAPPLLTKKGREYAAKVIDAYAKEEDTFGVLEHVLIHGEHKGKKWDKKVDQWVHQFEDALHSRNLPKSLKKAASDLISTTKKALHAIYYIDDAGHKTISGLKVRQSVGILLSDLIEALRVEISPYWPAQNLRTQNANMDTLRTRQVEMVKIVQGIFKEIPEAYLLLDETVIEIVDRNEKERGKDYFMKHYAPNPKDGSSKKTIKHIKGMYKDQQQKTLDDRTNRYLELMHTLLGRLEKPDQNAPEEHHADIAPDPYNPAQALGEPEQYHADIAPDPYNPAQALGEPAVFVSHTESTPVASERSTTIPDTTALATPPAPTTAASESAVLANSTSTAIPALTGEALSITVHPTDETLYITVHPNVTVPDTVSLATQPAPTTTASESAALANSTSAAIPALTDEASSITVHPVVTVTEPVTTTIHPTVTVTEPSTTTEHPTVTVPASVPSITVGPPNAISTATWKKYQFWTRGLQQKRDDDDDKRKKLGLGLGLGIPLPMLTLFATRMGFQKWAEYMVNHTKSVSMLRRLSKAGYDAVDLAEAATEEAATAEAATEEAATEEAAAAEAANTAAAFRAMRAAEQLGLGQHFTRLGGELSTTWEEGMSSTSAVSDTVTEYTLSSASSMAGQVAQMAVNEAGKDLARAGQLTESALWSLGSAVPNMFSWLMDQAVNVGSGRSAVSKDIFKMIEDAAINKHIRGGDPSPSSEWTEAGIGLNEKHFDHMDLIFGPSFRALQGLSETERLQEYQKDVERWRKQHPKLDLPKSEPPKPTPTKGHDAPHWDNASKKEHATTRPQETPTQTKAPQSTPTGFKTIIQGDKSSTGSKSTLTPVSTSTMTNSGSTYPLMTPAINSNTTSTSTAVPTQSSQVLVTPTLPSTVATPVSSSTGISTPIPTPTSTPTFNITVTPNPETLKHTIKIVTSTIQPSPTAVHYPHPSFYYHGPKHDAVDTFVDVVETGAKIFFWPLFGDP